MLQDIFNDIFNAMSIASDPRIMDANRVQNSGLKGLISKPHNLYTIKNKDGEVTEWKMEMVYTPFKKNDISVKITDNVLSVEIGTENKKEDMNLVYQGISNQYTKFSLMLSDKIDTENVSANADDGILTITMPVKKAVPQVARQISIC